MDRPLPPLTVILFLCALVLQSCAAPGTRLSTSGIAERPAEVSYHLLLHGCNYGNDPNTIAFLWPSDQPYSFEPHSPAFLYRTHENLPWAEAMTKARDFIDCSPHFENARLRAIVGPQGQAIGYELRPLYTQPSPFRRADILQVSYYQLADGVIRVYITPLPEIDDDEPSDP